MVWKSMEFAQNSILDWSDTNIPQIAKEKVPKHTVLLCLDEHFYFLYFAVNHG